MSRFPPLPSSKDRIRHRHLVATPQMVVDGCHGISSENMHRHFWLPAHHPPSHKTSEINILSHSLGINCYGYFQGCMIHV